MTSFVYCTFAQAHENTLAAEMIWMSGYRFCCSDRPCGLDIARNLAYRLKEDNSAFWSDDQRQLREAELVVRSHLTWEGRECSDDGTKKARF